MTKRAVSIAEKLGMQQTLDADSAYALGHELLEDGSEADYPTALIFFRSAAEAGVPEAQNDLATM